MQRYPIRRGDTYWITYAFPHEKTAAVGKEEGFEKQRPVLILQIDEDNRNVHYPLV